MHDLLRRAASRREIEERIVAVASGQHGVVTRAQLLEIGVADRSIAHRLVTGRLSTLHRGVYGVGPFVPPAAPLMAAVLACGPRAVLSHRSAAALHQLLAAPPAIPSVTEPRPSCRRRPGIRVWRVRRLDDDETTRREGIPVTVPLRTLIDLAVELDENALERVIARAERERLVTDGDLRAALERYRGRAGFRRFRVVLGRIGGPSFTRSEAEARFLALIRRARLPAPRSNVHIAGYEVDFLWPELQLAVEVDGYRYHGARARFEADRRRAATLAAHGIQVVSLTWRQIVDDEIATAVHLGQALARLHAARTRSAVPA